MTNEARSGDDGTAGLASRIERTPVERFAERAQEMALAGELPPWMEMTAYDTAKVFLGDDDDAYVIVCDPPRAARRALEFAQQRFAVFQSKLLAKPPQSPQEEERYAKEGQELLEQASAAEAEFLATAIQDFGGGVQLRADLVIDEQTAYRAGDVIPIPSAAGGPEIQRRIVLEAIPAFALNRVGAALNFILARAAAGIGGSGKNS